MCCKSQDVASIFARRLQRPLASPLLFESDEVLLRILEPRAGRVPMGREGAAYKLKPQMQGKLKNSQKADEVRRPKTSLELLEIAYFHAEKPHWLTSMLDICNQPIGPWGRAGWVVLSMLRFWHELLLIHMSLNFHALPFPMHS